MYELKNYYKVIITVLRNISEVNLKVLLFNNLKIVLSGTVSMITNTKLS